ncbi:uncharacterized protein [Rutidosis leptorrhynchoides]|uniref:uncharacterized protein n=1 Tax=Rutidosis leptorrhynchoides TaxID=125765 RepID=UPI003A9905FB
MLRCIELELELVDDDDSTCTRTVPIEFCVVHFYSCYNAFLGLVTLQKFGADPSTVHNMIKFPTYQGIATIRTESRRVICASVTPPEPLPMIDEQVRSSSILVNLKYPDKSIQIGGNLSNEIKIQLLDTLVANMDVFAWCERDMTRVPRSIAEHKLNANPNLTLVRQKKRPMASKRNGSWRMCVDFKDINKACPKDNYHVPEIDWKVESLSGFRLKNVRATYQRVLDVAFKDQIGRNLEAYIDDLVIKSNTEVQLLSDILETFNSLWKINMKLNPTKCSFRDEEGTFLEHIFTPRGIKANPRRSKMCNE